MVKHKVFFKDVPDESLSSYNSDVGLAYHFDAIKFAQWLQNNYAIPRGVKLLKKEFDHAVRSDNETIQYIITEDGVKIEADLFVDCSGFASLLLGLTLNEQFISYADLLPNSCAIATQLPYKDKEKELTPVTTCTAIENGWVWNIPLWSRVGSGYVYSPEFITDEDALDEFVEYLMSDRSGVARDLEDVKDLKFKKLTFRTGIHKRTWVGNVVAIGLSAGFIEPLESSGLYTVHEFLFQLLRALSKGAPTQWDKDTYNVSTYNLFNEFAEFVALHYALSKRTDTPYWEKLSRKSYVSLSKKEPSVFEGIIKAKTATSLIPQTGGYPYILVGMNYLPLDDISAFIGEKERKVTYAKEYRDLISYLTSRRSYWDSIISKQMSLHNYLETNVYYE
jgi:tryptophan halogenase